MLTVNRLSSTSPLCMAFVIEVSMYMLESQTNTTERMPLLGVIIVRYLWAINDAALIMVAQIRISIPEYDYAAIH